MPDLDHSISALPHSPGVYDRTIKRSKNKTSPCFGPIWTGKAPDNLFQLWIQQDT